MKPGQLLPFVLLAVAFWLLVIRPSQRQRAAKAALLSSLVPGSQVVTSGGIQAEVVSIEDDVVLLEIAPGIEVRFMRSAIAGVKAPHDEDVEPPTETSLSKPVIAPPDPSEPTT